MFAILGRTYETNLTCCLWNALIVYPELAALSTPNIVFSAKYPIFAPRPVQIIFLTTCASKIIQFDFSDDMRVRKIPRLSRNRAEMCIRDSLKTFTGWTAEIIQHEIDHCEGIVI